ncbi:hypothetical protein Bwad006_37390 [Bilophila wadsworthia]
MPGGAFWESGKPPYRFPSSAPLPSQGFRPAGAARKASVPVRSGKKATEAAGKVPAPCRKAFKAAPNGPYHKE